MRICVLTRPGSRSEEIPCVFHLGERRLPVVVVLDRWSEGAYRYFEVCVEDGRRFVLRHDPPAACWELAAVYAASRPRPAARLGGRAPLAALSPASPRSP